MDLTPLAVAGLTVVVLGVGYGIAAELRRIADKLESEE